ncbi:type I-E CRISPR-associated protein Cse2/CasB [Streptomyces varsoviensis]|uniref:type I-E CRISPR-associated protein Cse2/CasB n=1 Tax=Streptomyces varsoviensis TaxID=67373 RepID=UPI0006892F28|nr:type I-E CRISPR-associated protein Cse2/CasB [Streptomyces varsoviensis]
MTSSTGHTSYVPEASADADADAHATERSVALVQRAARHTIGRLQSGYRQDVAFAVAAVARLRREAGRDPHASPTAWGLDDLEDLSYLRDKAKQGAQEREEGRAAPEHLSARARRRTEARQEQEEQAVHLAVTLWALHQQSIRDASMHQSGWYLGRSVRRLAHGRTGTQDPRQGETPDAGEGGSEDRSPGEGGSEDRNPGKGGSEDRSPGASGPGEGGSEGGGSRSERQPVEDANEAIRKRFVRLGTSTDFDTLSGRLRQIVLLLRTARIPLDYGYLAGQLWLWQNEPLQDGVRRAWGREFHLTYAAQSPADGADADAV